MTQIRRHIVCRGSVQGVGFRYRVRCAAGLTGCTGWARNEWDGSVTLELQGTAAQIDETLRLIEQGRFIRIDSLECREVPPQKEYGFETD